MGCDLSIIVCTRNRADYLRDCLEDLIKIDKSNFSTEIIVVDNNSEDHTKTIVEEISSKNNTVSYYYLEQIGLSRARNLGIEVSSGSILAFLDDDCRITGNWAVNLLEGFEKYSADLVGGRVLCESWETFPEFMRTNKERFWGPLVVCDMGEKDIEYLNRMPFLGANMAIRRSLIDKVGEFDVSLGKGVGLLGEDTEYLERAMRNSFKCFYLADVLVYHRTPVSYVSFSYLFKWYLAKIRTMWKVDGLNGIFRAVCLSINKFIQLAASVARDR